VLLKLTNLLLKNIEHQLPDENEEEDIDKTEELYNSLFLLTIISNYLISEGYEWVFCHLIQNSILCFFC